MPRKNNYPPFEEVPNIVHVPMRIEFHLIAFTSGQISPQRLEDAIHKLLKDHEAFGYVTDISITRKDENNGS